MPKVNIMRSFQFLRLTSYPRNVGKITRHDW